MTNLPLNPNSNEFASKSELSWQAFQYISGEMTVSERDAFETELADSQPAREAIAQAVQLSEAVLLLESEPVVGSVLAADAGVGEDSFSKTRRIVAWATLTAAAICASFWIGSNWNQNASVDLAGHQPETPAKQLKPLTTPPATNALSLVRRWTNSEELVAVDPLEQTRNELTEEFGQDLLETTENDEANDSLSIPGWMIAAVSHDQKPKGMDSMDESPLPEMLKEDQ